MDIIISYIEEYAIFCTGIDFTEMFVMSLDFRDVKNNENMSTEIKHTDELSPSMAIFLFISDETIKYQNRSKCLILGVDGCFIFFV